MASRTTYFSVFSDIRPAKSPLSLSHASSIEEPIVFSSLTILRAQRRLRTSPAGLRRSGSTRPRTFASTSSATKLRWRASARCSSTSLLSSPAKITSISASRRVRRRAKTSRRSSPAQAKSSISRLSGSRLSKLNKPKRAHPSAKKVSAREPNNRVRGGHRRKLVVPVPRATYT